MWRSIGNNLAFVIVNVILPRLNEAPAVPWILGRVPSAARGFGAGAAGGRGGCVRAVRDISVVLVR
jgi:hypothetical protein